MPYHYAAHSPRGFSNEIEVHVFTGKVERDRWVAQMEGPRTWVTTLRMARRYLKKGTPTNWNYNTIVEHAIFGDTFYGSEISDGLIEHLGRRP